LHKNRAVNLHNIMKNRLQRLNCFLVVWLTMFSFLSLEGQTFYKTTSKIDFVQVPGRKKEPGFIPLTSILMTANQGEKGGLPMHFFPVVYKATGPVAAEGVYAQPANLYYLQSGFFCKREWELEKTTRIPFRFRLGSLADCNALEGKH